MRDKPELRFIEMAWPAMSYKELSDLPRSLRHGFPRRAQEIYQAAFNRLYEVCMASENLYAMARCSLAVPPEEERQLGGEKVASMVIQCYS